MSLKDLSLPFTTSFSAVMPEQHSPTNHSISSTRGCILNPANLADPSPERPEIHSRAADFPCATLGVCIHRPLEERLTLLPFSQVRWKGEESSSET